MSIPDLQSIHPKFHPSIINRGEFSDAELKERVERAISDWQVSEEHKQNVFEIQGLGGYVVKTKRTDAYSTHLASDTHLYRVRKALKMRAISEKYSLQDHIEIPLKYLYFQSNRWYVIAEKSELTDEGPIINQAYAAALKDKDTDYGAVPGQIRFIEQSSSHRALSQGQARALTVLTYESGYIDFNFCNFCFTNKGKFALLDLEPLHRKYKKREQAKWKYLGLYDFSLCYLPRLVKSIARLRVATNEPQVVSAINQTENYYLLAHTVKAVARLAITVLAWKSLDLLGMASIRLSLKIAMAIKTLAYFHQNLELLVTVYLTRIKDGKGLILMDRHHGKSSIKLIALMLLSS